MEGDPPAGPQGPGPGPDPRRPNPEPDPDSQAPDPQPPDPAPTAQGAEQGEQGAAEEPPSSDTPQDPPAAPGDTPVGAATNAAVEGDPPPYSPPARKRVRFDCPPCPPDCSQQEPIFYQPQPGRRARPFHPYHPHGIPPGPLPYNIYTGQPRMGPLPAGHGQDLPRDHLVEAVLVTICCCMLTGTMALIYSHETRAAIRRGDIDQAFSASRKAWFLILFSLLFGLFVSITWVICVLATLHMQRGP